MLITFQRQKSLKRWGAARCSALYADVAAAKIGLQCPGVMPPLAKVTSQVCRSIYLTRPPIGKPNLEAAAIRGGLVLDDADAVCYHAFRPVGFHRAFSASMASSTVIGIGIEPSL